MADAEYEAQAKRLERERAARAAEAHERAVWASVQAAEQRGEVVSARQRASGVARTHAEVIAEASARMDAEDRRLEARQRQEFRKWQS
jgi:hypothetical protein